MAKVKIDLLMDKRVREDIISKMPSCIVTFSIENSRLEILQLL
jgi:hypothetical protein